MEPWWGLRSSVTGVESALPPWDQLAWGWMRTGGPKHEREGRGPLPGLCPDALGPARLAEDWSKRVRLWGLPSP